MIRDPHIYVSVRFRLPSEGGRSQPITGDWYGCPMMFSGGKACDCRILLDGRVLEPGIEYEDVGVRFLDIDNAKDELVAGAAFALWESGVIADGTISSVC